MSFCLSVDKMSTLKKTETIDVVMCKVCLANVVVVDVVV